MRTLKRCVSASEDRRTRIIEAIAGRVNVWPLLSRTCVPSRRTFESKSFVPGPSVDVACFGPVWGPTAGS